MMHNALHLNRRIHEKKGSLLYWHNLSITWVAREARACMTDLGSNTDLAREPLKLSPQAAEAGITAIPECGQVPGPLCMAELRKRGFHLAETVSAA